MPAILEVHGLSKTYASGLQALKPLDLDRIKLLMKKPVLVDLRNIYKPADMRARGFSYTSVGRG